MLPEDEDDGAAVGEDEAGAEDEATAEAVLVLPDGEAAVGEDEAGAEDEATAEDEFPTVPSGHPAIGVLEEESPFASW